MPTSPLTLPDVENLPDDLASLKTLFLETFKTFQETLKDKDEAIERLRHQLYLAAKHRFGRKSEKISDDQLSLYLKEIEGTLNALARAQHANKPSPEKEMETITYSRKKGHGRNNLPEDLPRVRMEHPCPKRRKPAVNAMGPCPRWERRYAPPWNTSRR